MPDESYESLDLDCYSDREPTIEDIKSALDEGLKPFKRRKEQVEYVTDLLLNLLPNTEYSIILEAIKK
jgi:hypothetical protein